MPDDLAFKIGHMKVTVAPIDGIFALGVSEHDRPYTRCGTFDSALGASTFVSVLRAGLTAAGVDFTVAKPEKKDEPEPEPSPE